MSRQAQILRPKSRKSAIYLFAIFLLGALGCSSSLVNYEARTHIVQSGETLYTIAWHYGLNYEELARINRLSNPDLIFVGQRLNLQAGASVAPQPRTAAQPRALPAVPEIPPPLWEWPVRGTLMHRFGSDRALGNGIAVSGRLGQRINAAAAGRVVYAGNGLIGYGQLLIIKHNDTFLSAYGHNSQLRVAEGDAVGRGQAIAEMGLGPEQVPQLHFEIRRNGSPVDPLTHLPR
jgi:lipoprotein NlpD